MANQHVRAGATGTATGVDWTNAYTTLPATLTRGDTYYIAGGAYGGYSFNTAISGTTVITVQRATSADHGTNTGWSDTYDAQATFSAQFDFTTAHWVVDGITGGGPGNWNGPFGFKITEAGNSSAILRTSFSGTANDVTIRHVDLIGKGSVSTQGGSFSNDGLAVYGSDSITLSYYRMTGIGRCPFFISPTNFIAEYGNVVSYFGDASVHSEVASIWNFSVVIGLTTFRYTLIQDISSTGGLMWDNHLDHTQQLRVYGNVFYRPSAVTWSGGNGVVGGWTGGGGEDCYNMRIYNNTFINVNILVFTDFQLRFGNNDASNNLFYNCNSPSYSTIATHDFNHYINSGGTHGETNGTSVASGDPFTDYINLDFTLLATTVAGQTLATPYTTDPLGISRGIDGIWDRGAYEYGTSPAMSGQFVGVLI